MFHGCYLELGKLFQNEVFQSEEYLNLDFQEKNAVVEDLQVALFSYSVFTTIHSVVFT